MQGKNRVRRAFTAFFFFLFSFFIGGFFAAGSAVPEASFSEIAPLLLSTFFFFVALATSGAHVRV